MYVWTFGLVVLLVLSTWVPVSTGMEDDDDDGPEDCKKLKEEKCPIKVTHKKGPKSYKECEITINFNCTATCLLGRRTTITKTKGNNLHKTIYVCPTSTVFLASSTTISRSIPINPGNTQISSTPDNGKLVTMTQRFLADPDDSEDESGSDNDKLLTTFKPSFPVSSTADADDEEDDEDNDDLSSSISQAPLTVPSSTTSSALPKTSTLKKSGDHEFLSPSSTSSGVRTFGENVFSAVAPSFTGQFPSALPSTATTLLLREASVSSVPLVSLTTETFGESPSPSLSFTASSSSYGGEKDDDDDNDGDGDDDDDDDDDDGCGDGDVDVDDEDDDDDSASVSGSSVVMKEKDDNDNSKKSHGHSWHKPSILKSKRQTSSKQWPCKTKSVTRSTRVLKSRSKTSQEHVPRRTPPSMVTATITLQPVQPSVTFFRISPSVTSSILPTVIPSTVISKPDSVGTTASTKMLFPSTFVPTSSSYSLTTSATPPLSSSTSSESNGSISPTPFSDAVLSSSSRAEHSKVNSSVLSSSSNVTLQTSISSSLNVSIQTSSSLSLNVSLQTSSSSPLNVSIQTSSSISPTKSTTILTSSSVQIQKDKAFCGKSETGDKFEKGALSWPKTSVDTRAKASCPYNKEKLAYRWCRMNTTDMTHSWDKVLDENCAELDKNMTFDSLSQIKITEENESRIATLMDYLTSHSNASVDLVKNGADLLEKLVNEAKNLSNIRKELLSSVSNVMNAPPAVLAQANQEHKSTAKILKFIGKLMDEMSLSGQKKVRENLTNLVAEAWDVANTSHALTFQTNTPEQEETGASLVSVTLPASLLLRYKEKRRITFLNFMNDKLFPQNTDKTKKFINSKIVSASVKGDEVKNLSEPVVIEFRITNKTYANNCSCVFWDFEADDGFGRWSSNGCVYEVIGDGLSRCSCSHLTHFGVLVDLFPNEGVGSTDRLILEGITFIGCYLSIVGLVLTIITLTSFKKYRTGVSGQILLNLSLALLFSLVIFLAGIEQVDDEATCVTMAALLHYFVLVAVLWMGVEAFHMFVNIVLDRLPGELGRTFVLKCAAVAWVLPMFIVVITVLVNTDDYKNEQYCRVRGNTFYIAFLGPTLTVMLFNVIIFLLVVKSLLSTRIPSNRHKQGIVHFRRVLGIAVVFGVTWLFGVLAVGELRLIFQYLFCITNSFQGFMIFILYCLTDRKVRETLVRFLCALPDPNRNRIIDSTTSTQRPTDIEIDLSLFQERASSNRPRNWSGTWPMPGHPSSIPAWTTREESALDAAYPTGPSYNSVWEGEGDTLDHPYYYPYPTGSRPVANVPLPGEGRSDKLVESTMSQYLERSGGETSLQSGDGSIIFFNNGQRVEVPKYPGIAMKELSSSVNNNWERSPTRTRDKFSDASRMYESSFEGPRQYSEARDGLSFYKRGYKKPRHSSATTSMEMSKRFIYPKGKDYQKKGVHFPADELAISPDASDDQKRWSEMDWFPRMRSHTQTLEDDILEDDEFEDTSASRDGMGASRVGRAPRRTMSAQPSVRVLADDDVEQDYYRKYRKDSYHESEIASNFLAASDPRNSRTVPETTVRPVDENPVESRAKFRQSSASTSSSETSSNASFRWSEADNAPNLKSKSQTTFSDLNSDDDSDNGNETHFTQF